jgi:TolA-binding protein
MQGLLIVLLVGDVSVMTTGFHNLLKIICLGVLLLPGTAALGQKPVLALDVSSELTSILHYAIRNNAVIGNTPKDLYQAKAQVSDLQVPLNAKKTDRLILKRGLLLAGLQSFILDLRSGRMSNSENTSDLRRQVASLIQKNQLALRSITRNSRSTSQRSQARYLLAINALAQKGILARHVIEFAHQKSLARNYRSSQKILLKALELAGKKNPRISIPNPPRGRYSQFSWAVMIALEKGGLNYRIRRNVRANKKNIAQFPSSLRSAHKFSRRLTYISDQITAEKILTRAFVNSQRSTDWTKFPIPLRHMAHRDLANAITERQALALARKGQGQKTEKLLSQLSKTLNGQKAVATIDQRRRASKYKNYTKNKNAKTYDRYLAAMVIKYGQTDIMGSSNSKLAAQEQTRYQKSRQYLIDREIKTALRPKGSQSQRLKTISLVNGYNLSLNEVSKQEYYTAQTALIYARANKLAKTVGIFSDLALNGSEGHRTKNWRLAAKYQSKLANWSMAPPWFGTKKGSTAERRRLSEIYDQLYKRTQNWRDLSHLGLLMISQNQVTAALERWNEGLTNAKPTRDARQAAGLTLVINSELRRWSELELAARLCIERKIRPLHRKSSLVPLKYLATALYEGGKQLMADKKFGKASKKLAEFVRSFSKDRRRPDGMYRLAWAYRQSSQYPQSMETIRDYVETYPRQKQYANALFYGGSWAQEHAMEDEIIIYYTKFINSFRRDSRLAKAQDNLLPTLKGRELHSEAIAVYRQISTSKKASQSRRRSAHASILKMQFQYGDRLKAIAAAKQVLKLVPRQSSEAGLAYFVIANEAVRNARFTQAERLASELAKINGRHFLASEALSLVYLASSDRQGKKFQNEIFNLGLKDPKKTLSDLFASFKRIKGTYESVCRAGDTTFCAAAMHRISRLGESVLDRVSEIDVVDQLANKEIAEFNGLKAKMIQSLTTIIISSDQKSLEITEAGKTTPNWTRQILWTTSSDWSFAKLSKESSIGFIQFKSEGSN